MDRRSFLFPAIKDNSEHRIRAIASNADGPAAAIEGGLEPFSGEWNRATAGHLLRRCCFQFSKSEIDEVINSNLEETVDRLLDIDPLPEAPGLWTDDVVPVQPTDPERSDLIKKSRILQRWWLQLMESTRLTIRERLTFFWHNHFTAGIDKIESANYLYLQNRLLRVNCLGNFKDMAKAMVIDAAMLKYLDGYLNTFFRPNENFAREVLELFTLGEGNYTEKDIVEAAKALTGWNLRKDSPYTEFNVNLHNDVDTKEVMGQLIEPEGRNEYKRLIDIIFTREFTEQFGYSSEHPYYGKNVVAVFLATKLYRYFVYNAPNQAIVGGMADILVANNFEIKPVLRTLLTSAHFFDPQAAGTLIKNPLELMIGMLKQFNASIPRFEPQDGQSEFDLFAHYWLGLCEAMGLEVFEPPNVEGWQGHRLWISTATQPLRGASAAAFIEGVHYRSRVPVAEGIIPNVDAVARQFEFFETDIRVFVREATEFFLPLKSTPVQNQILVDTLLQGGTVAEWPQILANQEVLEQRLRSFFIAILHMPEYQLT